MFVIKCTKLYDLNNIISQENELKKNKKRKNIEFQQAP